VADNPADSSVQVGISLQNYSDSVIQYDVESFSVVIEQETVQDPTFLNRGGEIAPHAEESYYFPAIEGLDITRPFLDGSLEYSLRYGHPDYRPTRRMARTMRFTLFRLIGSDFVDNPRWTPTDERDDPLSDVEWSASDDEPGKS
jgi:hypothetical protein